MIADERTGEKIDASTSNSSTGVTFSRSTPPRPGPAPSFEFPHVERYELDNGLQLHICSVSRVPLVSLTLFLRAGEMLVGKDRAGLAVLAGNALDGGTRRMDGIALAEAFERAGARLGVSTGWEGSSVGFSCHPDRLPDALLLLQETVTEAAFPAGEVKRVRDQQLASIQLRDRDPAAMAAVEAIRRYFASDVPYSRPRIGSERSVGSSNRDHVVEFADSCYLPEGACLVVVGDVSAREVRALVERCFSGWRGTPACPPDFDSSPPSTERAVWVVDRPGSVQSELRVGHVGAQASSPRRLALSVGNLVLGGMFSSRLNLALRERHGFTYGVRSSFVLRSQPGFFQVSTSVGSDVTSPAVAEIFKELDSFVEDGADKNEVVAARDYAVGTFGLRLESVGQIASMLTSAFVHDLADDYYAGYRDHMRKVSVGDVREAARRHIRPQEAQVIVVGDAGLVVGPLEALGLGMVTVVDREG